MKTILDEVRDDTCERGFFSNRVVGKIYEFYLSGEIKESQEYIQWFNTIRNANAEDIVYIHVNSYGGDFFTAIQFVRVLRETSAPVVVSIEGLCCSGATLILMSASRYEISPHSLFMFHNASMASVGKVGEVYNHITAFKVLVEKLLREVYNDFFTPTELQELLDGKDFYMGSEEATKRLNIRNEKSPSPPKGVKRRT